MLCLSLLTASVAFAQNNIITKGGHFKATADEKQLETLNRLYNTDISFGELVEAVYPEALKHIPESALQNMYKTKVIWQNQDTPSNTTTTTQQSSDSSQTGVTPQQVIAVGHESNISTGQTIDFDSGSRVWLPYPTYRIPYMAVLSTLEREGVGIVASAFESDTNTYSVSASSSYSNPPSDNYRTVGYHYGDYPPNHVPPSYSTQTSTSWQQAP